MPMNVLGCYCPSNCAISCCSMSVRDGDDWVSVLYVDGAYLDVLMPLLLAQEGVGTSAFVRAWQEVTDAWDGEEPIAIEPALLVTLDEVHAIGREHTVMYAMAAEPFSLLPMIRDLKALFTDALERGLPVWVVQYDWPGDHPA